MKYLPFFLLLLCVSARAQSPEIISRCNTTMPKLAALNMAIVSTADLEEFKQAATDCVDRGADKLTKAALIGAFKVVLHIDAEIGARQAVALKTMDESVAGLAATCGTKKGQ